MLVADALMDFEQDALFPASVDAFDKWNGKSSTVKFAFDQNV